MTSLFLCEFNSWFQLAYFAPFAIHDFLVETSEYPISPAVAIGIPRGGPSLRSVPVRHDIVPFSLRVVRIVFIAVPVSSYPAAHDMVKCYMPASLPTRHTFAVQ